MQKRHVFLCIFKLILILHVNYAAACRMFPTVMQSVGAHPQIPVALPDELKYRFAR